MLIMMCVWCLYSMSAWVFLHKYTNMSTHQCACVIVVVLVYKGI